MENEKLFYGSIADGVELYQQSPEQQKAFLDGVAVGVSASGLVVTDAEDHSLSSAFVLIMLMQKVDELRVALSVSSEALAAKLANEREVVEQYDRDAVPDNKLILPNPSKLIN